MGEREILMQRAESKLSASENLLNIGFHSDAVSLAYFAMLFAARAMLSQKDIFPKTHKGVISQFALEFVKEGLFPKDLFNILTRSKENRQEADYGLFPEIEEDEAREILNGARKFLDECKRVEI